MPQAFIFVSHSSNDNCLVAEILKQLYRRYGFRFWFDKPEEVRAKCPGFENFDTDGKILVGDLWRGKIERAIEDSSCVLVFWSKESQKSKIVQYEARLALSMAKLVHIELELGGITGNQFEDWQAARYHRTTEDDFYQSLSASIQKAIVITRAIRASTAELNRLESRNGLIQPRGVADTGLDQKDGWEAFLVDTLNEVVISHLSRVDPVDRYSTLAIFNDSVHDIEETHTVIPDEWLSSARHALINEDIDIYGTQISGELFVGSDQPVSIWIPFILLGAVAVAYHAKLALKDLPPLNVHASIPDGVALVARASGGWHATIPPELIVVADAPSLSMSRNDFGIYQIRSFMPPCEQKIIVSNSAELKAVGEARTPTKLKISQTAVSTVEVHMTKLFNTIDWKSDKHLDRISFNIEPRIAVREILSGECPDARYPLWSPHWQLICRVGGGKIIDKTSAGRPANHWCSTYLMARQDFVNKDGGRLRRIEGQFRRSWLKLRGSESERRKVIRAMLSDENMLETMENACNLSLVKQFLADHNA